MTRLHIGELAPTIEETSLGGAKLTVPDPSVALVHLQFRRFAGCPICNVHVRSMTKAIEPIRAANVREIVFFHSSVDELREYHSALPFDVVADPEKVHYRAYGVERSAKSVLDPRAWLSATKGIGLVSLSSAMSRSVDHLGLPAEFLIDRSGTIRDAHYGAHADDHWSVEELLAKARALTAQ